MRILVPLLALALVPAAAIAAPPREESPAPRELLQPAEDDAAWLARKVAEAAAHPLGTLANPVRVGGPDGQRAYLARLRCADGSAPRIGATAPSGVGAFGSVTASVKVECGAATHEIAFDPYHDGYREDRPAQGFTIVPSAG